MRGPGEFANQEDYKAHVADHPMAEPGDAIPYTDEELREAADKFPPLTDADELLWSREEYRIEALRAASRSMRIEIDQLSEGRFGFTVEHVLNTAEQFAKWLETGKR